MCIQQPLGLVSSVISSTAYSSCPLLSKVLTIVSLPELHVCVLGCIFFKAFVLIAYLSSCLLYRLLTIISFFYLHAHAMVHLFFSVSSSTYMSCGLLGRPLMTSLYDLNYLVLFFLSMFQEEHVCIYAPTWGGVSKPYRAQQLSTFVFNVV